MMSFFVLFLTLFLSDNAQNEGGGEFKLIMSEVLTIPSNENINNSDYFFRNIAQVRTDSKGNIYVSDSGTPTVRKFDSNGIYTETIGNRGRGPGEFQEISAFTVDSNDHLIIFDHYSQRLSWKENKESNFSIRLRSGSVHVEPRKILEYGDKILVFRNERESTTGYGNLLHYWNYDADEIENSAISSEDIWDVNQIYGFANAAMMLVDISICQNGDLLLAPLAYEGEAWLYKNFPSFEKRIRLHGFDLPHPEHRTIRYEDRNRSSYNYTMYSGSKGRIVAEKFNTSMGIFELHDWIIHFIQFYNLDEIEAGVKIFSREGDFLGYTRLPELESGDTTISNVQAMWLDQENHLYVADHRDLPIIRKFSISIETE